MNDKTLYSALALGGAIPFLGCALLLMLGIDSLPGIGSLLDLVSSYGLAIVSFLAGIHWATYLQGKSKLPFNLMISSNVIFLAAWFAFALGSVNWSLLTQMVALLLLLHIDWRLRMSAAITADYFRTRLIATIMAVASLSSILLH